MESPPSGGGVPALRAGWCGSIHESRITIHAFQILNGVPSFFGTAAFLSLTYAGSPLR
jgi:hypothetical protein